MMTLAPIIDAASFFHFSLSIFFHIDEPPLPVSADAIIELPCLLLRC